MTTIKIRTYQPEFLRMQVELGNQIWKQYSYGYYSSLEQLEEAYSAETFDPELKLYAFDEKKLVGFATAKIVGENDGLLVADLAFPHVLNLDESITDLLYQELTKRLKAKGVNKITARAGNGRRNTLELAEKYDFNHQRDQAHLTWLKTAEIDTDSYPLIQGIAEFDFDRDIEMVSSFFAEQFSMSKENARKNFEGIRDMDPNMLLAHLVLQREGILVGRGFLQQLSIKDQQRKIGRMSPIIAVGENQEDTDTIRKGIFRHLVEICQVKGIENINIAFVGVGKDKIKPYQFLVSEFYTISIYEKLI